jgi:molybdopterin/thiamine biosynthesis adenylyltransferase
MRLDDRQIERYSRQIVLPELGAEGQMRLLDACVAVEGAGVAATEIVAYLAAAGVGTLVAPRALHDAADPAEATRLLAAPGTTAVDVEVRIGRAAAERPPQAPHSLWIVDGRAGAMPPCSRCAGAALPPPAPVPAELVDIRERLLGTVVATEVLKRLVGTGASLVGRVLAYDPGGASVTVATPAPRPACDVCGAAAREEG